MKKAVTTGNCTVMAAQFFCNNGQIINGSKGTANIDINLMPAWKVTQGGPNIIVGVVDTSVDYSSPLLQDNLLLNRNDPIDGSDNDGNGYVDDYNGWDFYKANGYLNISACISSSLKQD